MQQGKPPDPQARRNPEETPVPTRRGFLGKAIGAIAAFIGAALVIPLVGYTILPALKRRPEGWIDVFNPNRLKPNTPEKAEAVISLQDGWLKTTSVKSVWIVRKSSQRISVYSPLCTHLGCAYRWEKKRSAFFCPCHASVFDIDGVVLSGPAPRPLDTLPIRIERGRLWIIYKEFKPGSAKKIEI